MAGLELHFLGDFAVLREGRAMPLPPSKKTRALLAYLCLQPRRFRREHLSALLWEVPDDPRGSLRWSLSKLRRLVDEPQRPRVVADRVSVGIEPEGLQIDVRALRRLVGAGLAAVPTEALQAAASRWRGNFLEGLEFSGFHDFHAWCVAEREQAMRDRAALLRELVARLDDRPDEALPHARALVGLFPYDEGCRAGLIRLLNAARRPGEAEEQYQLGLRMLKEVGAAASGALVEARRAPRGDAAPAPAPAPKVADALVPPPSGAPLVGRDAEAAAIAEAIQAARQRRRAAVWLLSGAAGIGKTCLLDAAREQATREGAFVLQAAAFESDALRPFSVWIDALRLLDPALHDGLFGGADLANRERLFAGLSDLVAREAATRPVVLLLDDAQWCDESSAAALLHVARMNRDAPLVAVLAARDGELRDNVPAALALRGLRRDGLLREIPLGPLPAPALAALVAQHVPGADGARLALDSGGNPLLAIELARAEGAGSSGRSLEELVRERLAQLGLAGAEVLRWAAVMSPRIDPGTLVRVAGIDDAEVGAAFESAERLALLRPTGQGLRFAHELVARAVYTDISPLRRQVMHRRVAELLERDAAQDLARAAELAHHAAQSGDASLAARAMVGAGRLSLRFFANDDALSLARRGLQLAEGLPAAVRVCLEIDLHDILLAAGPLADREAAACRYAALAEQALDHGALAHARLGYHMASYVRLMQGDWTAAREQTLQAARVVRGGRDPAHIVGLAETAKCLVMLERDLPQADAILTEASALAERGGFQHHAIATGLGLLRFHEDRLDEAGEHFSEARTLCKTAGDRLSEYQANEYLVMLDLHRGRLEQARSRSRELLALGDRLREGSEEPFARAIIALCDLAIDDRADGLEAALADLRRSDAKHRLAYVLSRLALIDCTRGRAELARTRAAEALDCASRLERPTEMLLANAALSFACALAGDRRGAARHADEARRLAKAGAAAWTRDVLARLSDRPRRAAAEEAR